MIDVKLKMCELIANIINNNHNYLDSQQAALQIIGDISDSNYKKIFAYTADELGVDRFPAEWGSDLIETKLFQTYTGGDRFFKILDDAFINKDKELIYICACALSVGFKGNKYNADEHYVNCLKFLQLKPFANEYNLPKSRIKHIESNNFSLIKIFFPFCISYLIICCYEIFKIFFLSKEVGLLSKIVGGLT